MKRTTISLPDSLAAALAREALRRGVPVSQIAREAIAARLRRGGAGRRELHSRRSAAAVNIRRPAIWRRFFRPSGPAISDLEPYRDFPVGGTDASVLFSPSGWERTSS